MRRVYCLIRQLPHYRREAFFEAFGRLGLEAYDRPASRGKVRESDILVVWNRYGVFDVQAKLFEAAGAAVIVVENGYLPMHGTKKTFAIALGHHNGAGTAARSESRRHLLDVEIKPWRRAEKGEILILPQRGIGPEGVAMPRGWADDTIRRLRPRKMRLRPHPGTQTVRPVEDDLDGARCAVTWGSGAALKALCAGLPVFYGLKDWIGGAGAGFGLKHIDEADLIARMGDREAMLDNVARAQWSVEEVTSGEPIARLLEMHDRVRACA